MTNHRYWTYSILDTIKQRNANVTNGLAAWQSREKALEFLKNTLKTQLTNQLQKKYPQEKFELKEITTPVVDQDTGEISTHINGYTIDVLFDNVFGKGTINHTIMTGQIYTIRTIDD